MVFIPKIRTIDKIMQEYHRAEQKLKNKDSKSKSSDRDNKSLKGDAGIYGNTKKPVQAKSKITGTKNTSKTINKVSKRVTKK